MWTSWTWGGVALLFSSQSTNQQFKVPQTIILKLQTGNCWSLCCDDSCFFRSSNSFSLDIKDFACSARSFALCLAYTFLTWSTLALSLVELLWFSANFWKDHKQNLRLTCLPKFYSVFPWQRQGCWPITTSFTCPLHNKDYAIVA